MHLEEKLKSRIKRLLKAINLAQADCLTVGALWEACSASYLRNLCAACWSRRQKSRFAMCVEGILFYLCFMSLLQFHIDIN